MHVSIEQHRQEIAALCRRFGVRRLELFGSAARGTDFDPTRSDADFLIEFDATRTRDPLEQYFGFSEWLRSLLGRPVDLVERGAVKNRFILQRIDEEREIVYAA